MRRNLLFSTAVALALSVPGLAVAQQDQPKQGAATQSMQTQQGQQSAASQSGGESQQQIQQAQQSLKQAIQQMEQAAQQSGGQQNQQQLQQAQDEARRALQEVQQAMQAQGQDRQSSLQQAQDALTQAEQALQKASSEPSQENQQAAVQSLQQVEEEVGRMSGGQTAMGGASGQAGQEAQVTVVSPEGEAEQQADVTVIRPEEQGGEQSASAPAEVEPRAGAESEAQSTAALSTGMRAEDLMGLTVVGADGEELGEIEDVVLDPQSGEARQAVIASGGFLGMGEKRIAVDFQELEVQGDQAFVRNLTQASIEEMEQYEYTGDAVSLNRRGEAGVEVEPEGIESESTGQQ